MLRTYVSACAIVAVLGAAGCQVGTGQGATDYREGFRQMLTEARDAVFPSLVHVEVTGVSYWGGQESRYQSTGSGTIISPDGLVLTNAHVTDSGIEFWCTLADKRRVSATLVGEDTMTDLAVLQISMDELGEEPGLAHASFGDSELLEVGDQVLAMGSPYALDRTVTYGIVSNTDRVFTSGADDEFTPMYLSGNRSGMLTNWIQHDALINPGNSGGPLVNIYGEIIGINTRGGSGAGFATPSNLAESVANKLGEHGEVARTTIEVDLLHLERTGYREGVFVDSVTSDGPAAAAGLHAGDVILAINGERFTVNYPEQIPQVMSKFSEGSPGEVLSLTVLRADEEMEIGVTLDPLLPDTGKEVYLREWGLSLREITPFMARTRRFDSERGVLISGVRSGGPASLAEVPVSWGDVLIGIDGKPIDSFDDMLHAYDQFLEQDKADSRPESLLVEFDRNGKNFVTLFDTEEVEHPDPPRELPKAWIGIATQPVVPELAAKMGLSQQGGFRITRVYPRSIAADSELRAGDVIVSFDGEDIKPRVVEQSGLFFRAIRKKSVGDEAEIGFVRGNEQMSCAVELERNRTTPEEARRVNNGDFGLSVRAVTFFDRDDRRWDEDVKGVIVLSTESAGWAETAGITMDSLIHTIDGEAIKGTRDFERVMDRIESEQPDRVVFEILRGYDSSFKFVEPNWKPSQLEDADE
jgi:serine protease Do